MVNTLLDRGARIDAKTRVSKTLIKSGVRFQVHYCVVVGDEPW